MINSRGGEERYAENILAKSLTVFLCTTCLRAITGVSIFVLASNLKRLSAFRFLSVARNTHEPLDLSRRTLALVAAAFS